MNLTKVEAQRRASLVSAAAYTVSWDFTAPGPTFATTTTITFDAVPGEQTFLDVVASAIDSVEMNGIAQDLTAVVSEGRIELTDLKAHNTVTVAAHFAYRSDGQGIHKFVDPEDGETYLYSQFAAADARSAFPCFDQPDIRATFTLDATVPAHWVVVSNSPTPEPTEAGGVEGQPAKRWAFATTDPLPTYVAAIVAGPYASASGKLVSRKGELSAKVYGRKNHAAFLDAEEMIATAQAGLTLYERVFDTEYPYAKYDQIFVPEYNLGAMENVGCVTFSEDRLLFRSRPSDAMRQQRMNIVLHELSHMWFGNLVTMKWWDDLWLNESFAEFVGTWATEQATPWKDAWVTFGASRKSVAYVQDQLPTTHAIVTEIPDVEATVSAFDMITYAKGASALKQLAAHVGEDAFFAGVAAYLKRYRFSNATLAEFLAEVEAASGLDLSHWSRAWLETPGASTLRPSIVTAPAKAAADASREVIAELTVTQDVPAEFPVLRPHAVTVAGYNVVGAPTPGFDKIWSVDATIDGPATTIAAVAGFERPDLLLINDADRTYAKAQLDEQSLATIADHIDVLSDPAALASVLDALWHMCRDGHLPAANYIDAVVTSMPVMTNSETVEAHMRFLAVALSRYVPPAHIQAVATSLAERLWLVLEGATPGSDLQLQALKGYARFTATPAQAARLADVLDGAISLGGISMDPDLAWDLLAGLVTVGSASEGSIAKLLTKDAGATGQRRAAGVRAAMGTYEAKRAAWDSLLKATPPLPNAVQYEVAAGLVRVVDPALLTTLAPRILDDLRAFYSANEGWVGARVARTVFPVWAAGRVSNLEAQVEAWLEVNADAPSVLRKIVIEGLDDIRRALNAQRA